MSKNAGCPTFAELQKPKARNQRGNVFPEYVMIIAVVGVVFLTMAPVLLNKMRARDANLSSASSIDYPMALTCIPSGGCPGGG